MLQHCSRLAFGLFLVLFSQAFVAPTPAAADVEWHDCYAPYNHWRFADGLWRNGPHDEPLFRLRPLPRPFACGSYTIDRDGTARQILSRQQRRLQFGSALDRPDVEACARRYRSYDRTSNTYLGHDGRRRACRL